MTNKTDHTAFLCNLDGKKLSWRPETSEGPASIGMICQWGGFTIANISEDVPRGEANEYAKTLVDRYNYHHKLVKALRLCESVMCDGSRFISYSQQSIARSEARALLAELETTDEH